MSTVGEVVSRTYREYLALADDQPARAPLDAAVLAADTTWTLDAAILDADEADLFTPGILVECEQELALVTAVDADLFPATIELTVMRGQAGTTAANHADASLVYPAPAFPRKAVFDAVCDVVERLWPSLYHVTTTAITTAAFVSVPATVADVIGFTWLSGGLIARADAQLYTDLPVAISATGKAVRVDAGNAVAGTLSYRAKFARPTTEADSLATLGVESSWEQILVVGAAASLLAGRELEASVQEIVTEQLRAQGYPVLSPSRQRNELLRLYSLLLGDARARQLGERSLPVTMSMPA